MNLTRKSLRAVGLDIGLATTKLVVVERKGAGVQVVKAALLDHRQEGLLSEKEVSNHLRTWLPEQGYHGEEVVLSLPQGMVMAQLADFPPGAPAQLEDMVRYETQQLAGLSDESFLNGYRQTPPFLNHKNPVLLGVCRESMVRDRLKVAQDAGVNVGEVIMEGEALALAFQRLVPPADATTETQLLLDVGSENTTLVVLQAGQIAFVSSILFGGENFTEAMARHLGVNNQEAERTKRSSRVIPSDEVSPITRTAEAFTSELLTALEHWRNQAGGEQPEAVRFARVYLAGGGSQLGGLSDFLHDTFLCPIHTLGLAAPGQTEANGHFPIAYGLAISGLSALKRGAAVSFAPPDLRWAAKRRRRLPLAVISVVLLAICAASHIGLLTVLSGMRRQRLNNELMQLEQCRTMLPQLNNDLHQIDFLHGMLAPYAARANRNRKVYQAMREINNSVQARDWLYLFADDTSYRRDFDPSLVSRTAPPAAAGLPPLIAAGGGKPDDVLSYKPWKSFYVAGFTPTMPRDQLASVSDMIKQLNTDKNGMFANVDLVSDAQVSKLNFEYRQPWMDYFAGRFKPFTLRLPLKTTEFSPEKVE